MANTDNTNSSDESIDISLKERLIIPLLLPVIAMIATIILIIFIGEILLATVGNQMTLVGETIVLATWVALILTLLIMGAAMLVSRFVIQERTNSDNVTTIDESVEDTIDETVEDTMDVSLRERLVIPLLLPVIAMIATIILIIFIGEILLATVGNQMTLVGETIVLATWVALILTLLIMVLAMVASRVVTNRRLFNSSRKGET